MEIVRSYNLYLNSRQATIGGDSNNCTFNINPALTLSNRANRFLVSIPFLEVPYSFNQLSSSYNTLSYNFTDSTGSFTRSITIPVGNYNITNAISAFLVALNKSILLERPLWSLTSISITYNSNTSYCLFIMTALSTSITLKFSQNYVMALMFGFPQADQTFGTVQTLTSPNKVLVNPVNAIYLRSDSLKFGNAWEAVVSPYSQADILARVPVPTLPNSWIYYRNDAKQMLSNSEITSLNFYWSDNLNQDFILDLCGLPYGFQIVFDEVQLKPTNEGKDKIGMATVALPKSLVMERDKVLEDLMAERDKLEKEIKIAKDRKRQKEVLPPNRNNDTSETSGTSSSQGFP